MVKLRMTTPRRWLACIAIGLLLMLTRSGESATYYVDGVRGQDTNAGGSGTPFQTIAKAASMATVPGDVVIVAKGLYYEQIAVTGAGTPTAPITFQSRPAEAAVIRGSVQPQGWPGDDAVGSATANPYYVWRDFTFTGGTSVFQLRMALGWQARGNTFGGYAQNGINARADGVVITKNIFQDLQGHAYVLFGSQNPVISYNTIKRMNSAGLNVPSHSAVSKISYTDGLLLDHNVSQDNVGAGFWLDYHNTNYTISNNSSIRNHGLTAAWQGPGIWIEISEGPGTVVNHFCQDNTGACIGILESPNVTVTKGRAICGPGYAGVEFRNIDRGRAPNGTLFKIANERVTGMTFEGCGIPNGAAGATGGAFYTSIGNWKGFTPTTHSVVIKGNTYKPRAGQAWFDWLGNLTYTKAQSCATLGFECP